MRIFIVCFAIEFDLKYCIQLKDINPRNIHSRCLQLVKMTKEKLQTKIAELKLENAPHGELVKKNYTALKSILPI